VFFGGFTVCSGCFYSFFSACVVRLLLFAVFLFPSVSSAELMRIWYGNFATEEVHQNNVNTNNAEPIYYGCFATHEGDPYWSGYTHETWCYTSEPDCPGGTWNSTTLMCEAINECDPDAPEFIGYEECDLEPPPPDLCTDYATGYLVICDELDNPDNPPDLPPDPPDPGCQFPALSPSGTQYCPDNTPPECPSNHFSVGDNGVLTCVDDCFGDSAGFQGKTFCYDDSPPDWSDPYDDNQNGPDSDNDGTPDNEDPEPSNPDVPGTSGGGPDPDTETDSDDDGIPDIYDPDPENPEETPDEPGGPFAGSPNPELFPESGNLDDMNDVFARFADRVASAPIASVGSYFQMTASLSGTCPVWTIPEVWIFPSMTIDAQCNIADSVWVTIASIILATAAFVGGRIALDH
jgi:hypothetical protein